MGRFHVGKLKNYSIKVTFKDFTCNIIDAVKVKARNALEYYILNAFPSSSPCY